MKKIILLVSIFYLLIAPITYHPDTKLVLYYPTLGNEKVWDIYTYLNNNKDSAPKFHYPPFNYWLLKTQLPLVKLVGGTGLVPWLSANSAEAFLSKNIFLYNLATKLPLLILIMFSGFIIYKIVIKAGYSEIKARMVVIIWLLNPVTLYSGVMMGQNDILAILPFLVGLYYYFNYPYIAFIFFGIGSSVKSFPLIWSIVLAAIYPTKNWVKRIMLAVIPTLIYAGTLLPYIKYDYFRYDVLNSGLSTRIFEAVIDIGFGDKLLIVPVLLVILVLIGIKNNLGNNMLGVAKILVAASFIILGFSHFHPQWFMWIMPFLSIYLVVTNKNYFINLFFVLPWLGVILLFPDKFLSYGILGPINPSLINLPLVSELFNTVFLNNIFHSILAAYGFYWLYLCGIDEK